MVFIFTKFHSQFYFRNQKPAKMSQQKTSPLKAGRRLLLWQTPALFALRFLYSLDLFGSFLDQVFPEHTSESGPVLNRSNSGPKMNRKALG